MRPCLGIPGPASRPDPLPALQGPAAGQPPGNARPAVPGLAQHQDADPSAPGPPRELTAAVGPGPGFRALPCPGNRPAPCGAQAPGNPPRSRPGLSHLPAPRRGAPGFPRPAPDALGGRFVRSARLGGRNGLDRAGRPVCLGPGRRALPGVSRFRKPCRFSPARSGGKGFSRTLVMQTDGPDQQTRAGKRVRGVARQICARTSGERLSETPLCPRGRGP